MGLLDYIVAGSFRDEKAGRVVVFTGDGRNRGYAVRSESEELMIRSFLKMFYFAELSILLLGCLLGSAWAIDVSHALVRPTGDLLKSEGVFVAVYCLVLGVPFLLLWRTYRKVLLAFASVHEEVLVSEKSAGPQRGIVIVGLVVVILLFGVVFYFTGAK